MQLKRLAVVARLIVSVATAATEMLACSSSGGDSGGSPAEVEGGVTGSDAEAGARALPYPLNQSCPHPDYDAGPDASLNACQHCSRERCCDTQTAVLSAEYDEVYTCLVTPPDGGDEPAAFVSCLDRYPDQARGVLDHLACQSFRCVDECDPPPDAQRACRACTDDKCIYDSLACAQNADCKTLRFCFNACTDGGADPPACYAECTARFPEAKALQENLLVCATKYCSAQCN